MARAQERRLRLLQQDMDTYYAKGVHFETPFGVPVRFLPYFTYYLHVDTLRHDHYMILV